MKILYKLIFIIIILNLQSCTKGKEKVTKITTPSQELELTKTYKEALEALNTNDPYYAAKKF